MNPETSNLTSLSFSTVVLPSPKSPRPCSNSRLSPGSTRSSTSGTSPARSSDMIFTLNSVIPVSLDMFNTTCESASTSLTPSRFIGSSASTTGPSAGVGGSGLSGPPGVSGPSVGRSLSSRISSSSRSTLRSTFVTVTLASTFISTLASP